MKLFERLFCRTVHLGLKLVSPLLVCRIPATVDLETAAEQICRRDLGHALLVTGRRVREHGLCAPLLSAFERAGICVEIFDDVPADPTVSCVEAAVRLYRERGCDCVVAVGGGSPMDCAKGVCARIASPRKTLLKIRGPLKVGRNVPLFLAVPTTAGSGSEATAAAVFRDEAAREKFAVFSPRIVPRFAVLDPALTRSLPPSATAETGMDALTHAVEAYIGGATTRRTRALCVDAVRLIRKSLPKAYADGEDLGAREDMQLAAFRAGIAFTRSYVGYVHALAHALGGAYGIPHGRANAMLLPVVLKAYGGKCTKKLARLARLSGVCEPSSSDMDASDAFIGWIEEMDRKLSIPQAVTIPEEEIPLLSRRAAREANPLYPVPRLMDAEELSSVLLSVRKEED